MQASRPVDAANARASREFSGRQCVDIGHRRATERARTALRTDPIRCLAPLSLCAGDVDVATHGEQVLETELLGQRLNHRFITGPTVCDHSDLDSRRHRVRERTQQIIDLLRGGFASNCDQASRPILVACLAEQHRFEASGSDLRHRRRHSRTG